MDIPLVPLLPTDLWKLIWTRAKGAPIRFVCRHWRDNHANKKVTHRYVRTVALLEWMRSIGYMWNEYTCAYAAENGYLEVLKYLFAKGCSWNITVGHSAARYGQLDVLKWLFENRFSNEKGISFDTHTPTYAAEGGHVEVVELLWGINCPWSTAFCGWAAMKGHINILEWSRGRCFPGTNIPLLDIKVCDWAIDEGRFEVIQWAFKNGVQWNKGTYTRAHKQGRLKILKWMFQAQFPGVILPLLPSPYATEGANRRFYECTDSVDMERLLFVIDTTEPVRYSRECPLLA